MTRTKLSQCAEGLIVTAAGIIFTVLSLNIRNNPVTVEGPLNLLIQAKFIPLLLSVLILIQGISLTVALLKGKEKTENDGGYTPRAALVVLLTVAYLFLVSLAGFAVPTVVYMGALLFVVNKGRKPLQLLILTLVYSVIALLVIPGVLNLQLL